MSMPMMRTTVLPVPPDEFVEFLVAAHRHGYAAQGDETWVPPLLPGSRQLEYARGSFAARDAYFGSVSFVGQETVYYLGQPVWAMCYAGGMLQDAIAEAEVRRVYEFLRTALRAVTPGSPYRGPASFRLDDLVYVNEVHGEIASFWGVERIIAGDVDVYRLRYAGGVIR